MPLTLIGYRKLFAELPEGVVVALDDGRTRAKKRESSRAAAIIDRERKRLSALERYERQARRQGFRCIAGVDEVGRGPLAGPLVAAAVVFERQPWIPMLNDSKQLSEEEREALFDLIQARAAAVGLGVISVEELNASNLHVASLQAMQRALGRLHVQPDYVLVDGCYAIPALACKQLPLVKGDALSMSVAAASIVAKVTRDRYMNEMDVRYPQYGFRNNKGYATLEHRDALRSVGPSPIHRILFKTVALARDMQMTLWD